MRVILTVLAALLATAACSACGPDENPEGTVPPAAKEPEPPRKLEWHEIRIREIATPDESLGAQAGSVVLTPGMIFAVPQDIEVADGVRLTIGFPDDARLLVVGPAKFSITESSDAMRTVWLESGAIDRFEVKDVTTGVKTAEDLFAAAKDATISVSLEEVEGVRRTTFLLVGGNDVRVVHGGTVQALTLAEPIVVERPR
jgi:hypothetical protein